MPTFDVVCLANSRKHGGRCMAGLRLDGGGWIRPVVPGGDGALWFSHYTLADGSEARPLDVIALDVAEARPEPHQPENWTIGETPWRLVSRPASQSIFPLVRRALARGPNLLGGRFSREPWHQFEVKPASSSLALVNPDGLSFCWLKTKQGRRQLRARFVLNGQAYDLVVTDLTWEEALKDSGAEAAWDEIASVQGRQPLLTISLGEPTEFDGSCYKLVAAVIPLKNETMARLRADT
jgi:Dual OB-containing domain